MIQRRDKKRTASAKRIQAAFLEENHIDIEEIPPKEEYVRDTLNKQLRVCAYLQKLFHENRSTSVMRFVQRYRLEKSCQLLIESELSIDEICNAVGVGDLKNYYSYFKRYFNVTPQAFRITHRSKKNNKFLKNIFKHTRKCIT